HELGGDPPDLWVHVDEDEEYFFGASAPVGDLFRVWVRTSRYDGGGTSPPPSNPDDLPALGAAAWSLGSRGGQSPDTLTGAALERPVGTGSTWTWSAQLSRPRRGPASHVGVELQYSLWY